MPSERLVALDVDGTLLTSAGDVSARTRRSLERAAAAGWHVVLVTGRPLDVALPVVHDLALGEYVVAANGATIAQVPTGVLVFQSRLPGALVARTIHRARRAVPGLRAAVTTPRGFCYEAGLKDVAPLTNGVEVDDACPHDDEPVQTAILFRLGLPAAEVLARVREVAPDGVEVSPSGLASSVDLTAPGVHKGSGLARLCELVGVARGDTVAFGDGWNDHEMLRWAGLGVAMGNADPGTQAVADEVTAGHDADGIAEVMERLLG